MQLKQDELRANISAEPTRILIISRKEESVQALKQLLTASGFANVDAVRDARLALPAFLQMQPDAVLVDADLEQFDALSVMKQLSARTPADEFLPFVVLSGENSVLKQQTHDAGLTAFFKNPADPVDVLMTVRDLVDIRAKGVRLARAAQQHAAESKRTETEAARHLARFAELKDHPGSGHTERVGQLSAIIAHTLGMPDEDVRSLRLAAQLHDVGKVGIPDAILFKDAPLALEEMDLVKTHTTIGAVILAGSTTPLFRMAEEIALYHHENWDGSGYTPGLASEAIPLVGRIVRVTDAFDAMTSTRPFAEGWRRDNAIEFIRAQSGRIFDPLVVEAFLHAQAEAEEPDELANALL